MQNHALAIVIGKALGMFGYMVWEQILGRTRFGGTLGLVKATARAILESILKRVFKRKNPQEGKEPR